MSNILKSMDELQSLFEEVRDGCSSSLTRTKQRILELKKQLLSETKEPPHKKVKRETSEYIYAMMCADMPHLKKIGITNVPYHRLKSANSHDTYKPPSGFEYAWLLRVESSRHHENEIKETWKERRRKNPNGNWTEFFVMTTEEMNKVFSSLEGERMDVTQFEKGMEKEEMRKMREFLTKAVQGRAPCTYLPNPKTVGSKSHVRYEKYREAKTLDQVQPLGGKWEDIVYDYMAGFFRLY